MHHTVVLGAGISGLTAAYRLKRQGQHVTLLEASSRHGGWIRSERVDGFLFEYGPRGFRPQGQGVHTVELVRELGIESEIVTADSSAHHRYLLQSGELRRIPLSRLRLFGALLRDFFTGRSTDPDESVYDFFTRRFGKAITETYCEALVTGIFAGDPRELSVASCFPKLHTWERQYGSVVRGSFLEKKQKTVYRRVPLLSFREGMETLPKALAAQLDGVLQLNCAATAIRSDGGKVYVTTSLGMLVADRLISTLPAPRLATMLPSLLPPFRFASMALVCCGWKESILPKKGFGYLAPPSEDAQVLGMVWDSSVFPEQNSLPDETRITVMLGGSRAPLLVDLDDDAIKALAMDALQKHVGIKQPPNVVVVRRARGAIPQFPVGHSQWVKSQRSSFENIVLSGTSFGGVAINDCIASNDRLNLLYLG